MNLLTVRRVTACASLLLAACGGNVVVDHDGSDTPPTPTSTITTTGTPTSTITPTDLPPLCGTDREAPGCQPEEVAATDGQPVGITVDETHVYWTTLDGALWRAPLDGGTAEMLAYVGGISYYLAGNALHLYMATYNSNQVVRVGKDDGFLDVLQLNEAMPAGIAVDGTHVYWASTSFNGTVRRRPLAGGAVETLLGGFESAWKIVLRDGVLYVADQLLGRVARIPLDGAPVSYVATNQLGPVAIAVDATSIYSADADGGQITRAPREGGPTVTLADAGYPIDIVVDDQSIYWTDIDTGRVSMLLKDGDGGDGGDPIVLADGQDRPQGIAASPTHIYWVETFGDRVMRVAK